MSVTPWDSGLFRSAWRSLEGRCEDCTLRGCCLSTMHKWSLHYVISVFITLFKHLSQFFNALDINNILIKYAGSGNQDRGIKPKKDLAERWWGKFSREIYLFKICIMIQYFVSFNILSIKIHTIFHWRKCILLGEY